MQLLEYSSITPINVSLSKQDSVPSNITALKLNNSLLHDKKASIHFDNR